MTGVSESIHHQPRVTKKTGVLQFRVPYDVPDPLFAVERVDEFGSVISVLTITIAKITATKHVGFTSVDRALSVDPCSPNCRNYESNPNGSPRSS